MLELFAGPTPNGQKVAIALEELGLEYHGHHINILQGDQLTPEFLAINPNNKQPALVDPDGPGGESMTVWESCAILIYLAQKCGRLLPRDPVRHTHALQWLFFQASTQGPMAGQYAHFAFYAAPEHQYAYAVQRYSDEMNRQLGVMDRHLASREYFVDEYSIADIALLPYALSSVRITKAPRPHLQAWIERLTARAAVRKGLALMIEQTPKQTIAGGMQDYGDEHRAVLFGERQFAERTP